MKFPFQKYAAKPIPSHPTRNSVLRPTIPITITNKTTGENERYIALIDSGADYCIFHASFGQVIGLNIKSGKELTYFGIEGGGQTAYFHDILVGVGGWNFECYAGFSEYFDQKNFPYGILGQNGFFDKFRIILDSSKCEIELKENPNIKFSPFKTPLKATI